MPALLNIDLAYGALDADTAFFLKRFDEPPGAKGIEAGANEEYACPILAENGYPVFGVDLRPQHFPLPKPINYHRSEADFVTFAAERVDLWDSFDFAFSLSALEHFGLGGYDYHLKDELYDAAAVDGAWRLLRPGGVFYVTVPYGRAHLTHGVDWRVYNHASLRERIVRQFEVVDRLYFLSGGCACPAEGPEQFVKEADADAYSGEPPHVTVYLRMRKAA